MFPELATERLLLQRIEPGDQQFVYEGLSHPEIIPFYGVRYLSFDDTKNQMEWYERLHEEGSGAAWKIIDKTTGAKLGVVVYYYHKPEHRKAELGFWIFPQFWNNGVTTEALTAVIRYCQKEKNIHRLEAFVEEGNHASRSVLEKLNFVYEGMMRDCEVKNDRFISLLIYALFSHDGNPV